MLKDFRAYQLAVRFYKNCENVKGARHLHDQLIRASSSIALNLAEGSERVTDKDRRRFYRMAMGSTRECQAILDLLSSDNVPSETKDLVDSLAASIFKLCKSFDSMK